MICYLPAVPGGYYSRIKIENLSMLLIINISWWFPNTKANITKLFKLMYRNQERYELGDTVDLLIKDLYDYQKRCRTLGDGITIKKLDKNIDYLKVLNGLYGG